MAFQPIDITAITTYEGTRTTSFTTTITATSDQRTFTNILFPSQSVTIPSQYTTLPPLADPTGTYYPSSLPVLVITEAVAIIYNVNGTPITTGTFIQTPSPTPLPAAKLLMNPECSSWSCWAPSERIGTSIAIAFFIVGVIGLLWWGFWYKPRKRPSMRDLESGRAESRLSQAGSRRSSRPRSSTSLSYTSSGSSSIPSRPPQYQSYVRTRSRSRARALANQRRASQRDGSQKQHASRSHSHETKSREFALPAAAGLAAAAALGIGASRNRSLSTTALPRSSFHNDDVPRSRPTSHRTRDGTGDRLTRISNADRRRASHSPPQRGRSKSNPKNFGSNFGMSDKWMALLPFVLDVLYGWSELKGGWDQVRSKGKGVEQQVEDFGHKIFNSKARERSRSSRRSYQESPRRAQSVNTAYVQLRPPRQAPRAEERNRDIDMSRIPRSSMQEGQAKIMNYPDFNLSATAEAGRRRSPASLHTPRMGRSERRRITRREARRKRDGTGYNGVVTSDTEASTAADQRQVFEEGDRERSDVSAPTLGQSGERTFPFPLPSKIDPASNASAPPALAIKPQQAPHSGAEQGKAQ